MYFFNINIFNPWYARLFESLWFTTLIAALFIILLNVNTKEDTCGISRFSQACTTIVLLGQTWVAIYFDRVDKNTQCKWYLISALSIWATMSLWYWYNDDIEKHHDVFPFETFSILLVGSYVLAYYNGNTPADIARNLSYITEALVILPQYHYNMSIVATCLTKPIDIKEATEIGDPKKYLDKKSKKISSTFTTYIKLMLFYKLSRMLAMLSRMNFTFLAMFAGMVQVAIYVFLLLQKTELENEAQFVAIADLRALNSYKMDILRKQGKKKMRDFANANGAA